MIFVFLLFVIILRVAFSQGIVTPTNLAEELQKMNQKLSRVVDILENVHESLAFKTQGYNDRFSHCCYKMMGLLLFPLYCRICCKEDEIPDCRAITIQIENKLEQVPSCNCNKTTTTP